MKLKKNYRPRVYHLPVHVQRCDCSIGKFSSTLKSSLVIGRVEIKPCGVGLGISATVILKSKIHQRWNDSPVECFTLNRTGDATHLGRGGGGGGLVARGYALLWFGWWKTTVDETCSTTQKCLYLKLLLPKTSALLVFSRP